MPEEGLTVDQYNDRISVIKPIDWSRLRHAVAEPEKYCTGVTCEIPIKGQNEKTMSNVLLIVDTKNLFNTLHKSYGNGKIDYQKFVELAAGPDHIFSSIAYGQQSENNSVPFMTVLSKLGFVCKFKQLIKTTTKTLYPNNNVQLTIDVIGQINSGKIDRVVLGSSDPELIDLVKWVRDKGFNCDIVACRIPKVLKDIASSVIEIDESILLPVVE